MQNATLLASVIGPVYLIMGLSMLMYVKVWKKIVLNFSKDHISLLFGMIFSLVIGLIVVNLYNVWTWDLYLIITLTGWGGVLKGIFYFLAPGDWMKEVIKWQAGWSNGMYYFASVFMIVIGGLLSYNAYMA